MISTRLQIVVIAHSSVRESNPRLNQPFKSSQPCKNPRIVGGLIAAIRPRAAMDDPLIDDQLHRRPYRLSTACS